MDMFTYYDYEDAFYLGDYSKCKEIGIHILSSKRNKEAKELLSKLKQINYSWTSNDKEKQGVYDILVDVKKYLLANCLN